MSERDPRHTGVPRDAGVSPARLEGFQPAQTVPHDCRSEEGQGVRTALRGLEARETRGRDARVTAEGLSQIRALTNDLASTGRPVRVMEVCGTHTMAVARSGLRHLLPPGLRLISGPGCPVCVTESSYMDRAIALARRPEVVVATFGDLVRVPGRGGSLAGARSDGAAVEVVVSPLQAVELAERRPERQVVFLAVGFETTAPGTALMLQEARRRGLRNLSVLTAHKRMVPAMRALLSGGDVPVDGFLCPGHVSVIVGWGAFGGLASEFGRPCVTAGFDARQIVLGLVEILRQLSQGQSRAANVYPAATAEGNAAAQTLLSEVFEPADASWRAMGCIPGSGLALRGEWSAYDAARRFELPEFPRGEGVSPSCLAGILPARGGEGGLASSSGQANGTHNAGETPASHEGGTPSPHSYDPPGCRCGDVILGRLEPRDCPLFATHCTSRDPVGPCMISSEGACAAAFKYGTR